MSDGNVTLCSTADLRNILRQAKVTIWRGNFDDAATSLDYYLKAFVQSHLFDQRPAPSALLKRFRAIEKAARELRAQLPGARHGPLGVDENSVVFNSLAYAAKALDASANAMGVDTLNAALDSVSKVEAWAKLMVQRTNARIGRHGNDKHKGDRAVNHLLGDLIGLWFEHCKEVPSVWVSGNRDDSAKASPFVRFTVVVRDHLLGCLSDADYTLDRTLRNSLNRLTLNSAHDRIKRLIGPVHRAVAHRGKSGRGAK